MFSLRNITPATKESIEALAAGFEDKSALFRHEIAYVFGQLNSKWSVPALLKALRDSEEVGMVRHECAEALGGIASEGEGESGEKERRVERRRRADFLSTCSRSPFLSICSLFALSDDSVLPILREFAADFSLPDVVRESCLVAVDMWEVRSLFLFLPLPLFPILLLSLLFELTSLFSFARLQYETSNQFQYADTLSAEDLAIEEKLKNIGGSTGFERSAAI